jgi:hypothetical protein
MKHANRRTSRPVKKQFRIQLRPGDRLVTPSVILTARKVRRGGTKKKGAGGVGATVTITCQCTAAEPNKPDCTPQSTTSPGGHTTTVKCVKSGGCKTCTSSTTTTTTSVFIA